MGYSVSDYYAEGYHTAECKGPLSNRDSDKTRLSIAVLHGCLERIGTAKLGVCDDESDCPIDSDGESN